MTAAEIQSAVEAGVAAALASHMITPTEHAEQHAFLASWIEREKRKQERWETIRQIVIGGLFVSALVGIGAWVLSSARALLDLIIQNPHH
jgi:hypothetical protein